MTAKSSLYMCNFWSWLNSGLIGSYLLAVLEPPRSGFGVGQAHLLPVHSDLQFVVTCSGIGGINERLTCNQCWACGHLVRGILKPAAAYLGFVHL